MVSHSRFLATSLFLLKLDAPVILPSSSALQPFSLSPLQASRQSKSNSPRLVKYAVFQKTRPRQRKFQSNLRLVLTVKHIGSSGDSLHLPLSSYLRTLTTRNVKIVTLESDKPQVIVVMLSLRDLVR